MKPKWSVRPYREGDEEKILELWKAVYPEREYDREKWMRWWRWMYQDNPVGVGKIWLAEYDGKIVGQYSLISMNVKVGNEILKASQNIDLMTHPGYQRQGIFSRLERKALDEAEKAGVSITIGFSNDTAYPGHIKSGWFDVYSPQIMFKPLNWGNALKVKINNKSLLKLGAIGGGVLERTIYQAKNPPFVRDLTINQISSFDDRINEFWTSVSNQHQIMVVRNKDYLNWRYGTPDVNYAIFVAEKAGEICGYLILQAREQRDVEVVSIFDIMAQSPEVMHCLVSKAVEHCRQNNIDLILYQLVASKAYHRTLKRCGFLMLPFIKGGHFCAYSSSPSISKEFLANPRNWFVQVGDSDAT